MPNETILDSTLYVRLNLSDASALNLAFASDPSRAGQLANHLLLYEKIIIPTVDFGIVPILASWLGPNIFLDLLNSHSFGFIKRSGLLGYAGNGNGISGFEIQPAPGKSFPWSAEAIFSSPARALELQLANSTSSIRFLERYADLILSNNVPFEYSNQEFMSNIVHETYTDIMKSPSLRKMITLTTPKRPDGSIDLTRLPQTRPDQMRILIATGAITDPIDLVLRIAEVNFELWYASHVGGADMFTATGSAELLKAKLARYGAAQFTLDGFLRVLDLNQMPDIASAVAQGKLPMSEVAKIRQSASAIKFRRWLRNANPQDGRDLEREFVAAISRPTITDSLPVKLVRFVLTTAAGLVFPLAGGIAASAVDSFFVDKWLKGFSPRMFLDDLRRLEISGQEKDSKS